MSIESVISSLRNEREEAVFKHDEFIKQIDNMLDQAEALLTPKVPTEEFLTPKPKPVIPKPKPVLKKLSVENIIACLRLEKRTLHLDEICELLESERGEEQSKLTVAMLISHYLRKFKKKAKIKQIDKKNYIIKA